MLKIKISVSNFIKAEDAFGNSEYYIDMDGIRLIIRKGKLEGWYRPEGSKKWDI